MAKEMQVPIKVSVKGTEQSKRKLKGVEGGLKSLGKSAALAAAGFFGARMLIQGLKSAVQASAAQELAEKKLEAALGKTSKALLQHASALQKVTMFGDETILEAQAMLAAFIKDEEQLKKATQATLDLAAAKGFDLVTAADLVGKSVGSSTNALTRYGIEVKGAVGSTERLEMLTTNVAELFGGQARAQAETMAGTMTQMSNAIGDAAEAIGDLLGPAIITISKGLKTAAEWAEKFFDGLKPVTIQDAIDGMEELGMATDKIAKLKRLELTREVMKLGSEMRSLGIDSSSMAEITKDIDIATETLASQYDNLGGLLQQNKTWQSEATMSVIEGTEAEIANLQTKADLIKAYEIAQKQLETFGTVQDQTKTKTKEQTKASEEQTAAYVAQTEVLTRWSVANQEEVRGRESVQGTFAEWMFVQQEAADARDKELEYQEILKLNFPLMAKGLGLLADEEERSKAAKEAKVKLITQELKSAALVQGSAKDAMMAVVRAESMEAAAGLIASILKIVPFPLNVALAAGGGAVASGLIDKGLAQFAQGGDFVTSGPQMIMVGDNPGGRERVQVTPLSSPNVSGPTNEFSINVSAPLVDETVVDSIIPAIQKAQRLGTA